MNLGMSQRIEQSLQLWQKQYLIMCQTILQHTSQELEQLVRKELEENPALESEGDDLTGSSLDAETPATGLAPDEEGGQREAEGPEVQGYEESDGRDTAPPEGAFAARGERPESPGEVAGDADMPVDGVSPPPATGDGFIAVRPGEEYAIKDLIPDETFAAPPRLGAADDSDVPGVELAAGPAETMAEKLLPRLRGMLSEEDGRVAEFIVESLDDDGFLTMPEEEIAANQGVEVERVRAILYALQRIEPGGIGCRDRRESFLVQLELAGYEPTSLERKLLSDYWEMLTRKQTGKIAKLCGVTDDDIKQAIGTILRLNPRPAAQFTGSAPVYVAPDFSIEWQGDRLVAVPNDETVPSLRLSRHYRDILLNPKTYSREQYQFAQKKARGAIMFMKAIESRRRNMLRIVRLITEDQREFFVSGKEALRPATMRDAAGRLGVDASTVSRAVAGKYVETPHGIFPLSFFFKAGAGGKSRTSIKERIKEIIDAEDKSNPLSDDAIGAMLKDGGVEVSRRTVAKYRAELGIAGCNERKSF